ncbi:hypothetical protein CF319_g7182 [Tilletia indica]|nr:hypothetical protein CF319_g7182 [Tilletia indica]
MSSQNKHPREDAADNTRRTRAKSVRQGAAGTSSEINVGGNVAGDVNVVNRTVVTRVNETYETIPRAQPAIEKILNGLKDLTKISADQSSTQSGLDRVAAEAELAAERINRMAVQGAFHTEREATAATEAELATERAANVAVRDDLTTAQEQLTTANQKLAELYTALDRVQQIRDNQA